MPRTVSCPVCHGEVKIPRDAEPGDQLTCPHCAEVFTPPHLRKKAYDPEDEAGYAAREADDEDREDRVRKARRVMARAYADRDRRPARKKVSWFQGPEIWLLIFAVGSAGGLPFGFWLARNWDKLGAGRTAWLFVGLVGVAFLCFCLGCSAWAWLRKNR